MGHIADPALLQVLLGLQGLAALQKHSNRAVAPGNGDGLQRFAADRLRMQRGGAPVLLVQLTRWRPSPERALRTDSSNWWQRTTSSR